MRACAVPVCDTIGVGAAQPQIGIPGPLYGDRVAEERRRGIRGAPCWRRRPIRRAPIVSTQSACPSDGKLFAAALMVAASDRQVSKYGL